MTDSRGFGVFTREGDGTAEVDEIVRVFGSPEQAGLHRHFYVTRANQTVVMTKPDSPLAEALRQSAGWQEPRD